MKLLFLLITPQTTINILLAIKQLSEGGNEICCLVLHKMSSSFAFPKTTPDLRPKILEDLRKSGVRIFELKSDFTKYIGKEFKKIIQTNNFDLVISDTNKAKLHWGGPLIYNECRKQGIPVIGCQEGSLDAGDAGLKTVHESLGISYDYCFCL